MAEALFQHGYPASSRLAAVHAAMTVNRYRLPVDFREDLEQEALTELWRKRGAFDPQRGSWRTFAEAVVSNRMASLLRSIRSSRSGRFREQVLAASHDLAVSQDQADLRVDISRVLAGATRFDRRIARSLMAYTASETGDRLGISRAAVYRAVGRLRVAFLEAGYSARGTRA